jgi:carbon storage regulator
MLVLTRKINETIMIGDNIEITVVSISGDTVRLGIEAPREVKILRREVYEEIQRQNREAMAGTELALALQRLKEFQVIHQKNES